MNEIINEIRTTLTTLISITLAYFAPIQNMVFVMFFLFLLNMVAGLIAGIIVDNEEFQFKKFFHCILETFCLYTIVLTIFLIGEKMENMIGAMQCISGIVYTCVWFYGTNILRNLKKINPDSKIIAFLYYVMSFEIVKKIPYLQNFQNNKKSNDL